MVFRPFANLSPPFRRLSPLQQKHILKTKRLALVLERLPYIYIYTHDLYYAILYMYIHVISTTVGCILLYFISFTLCYIISFYIILCCIIFCHIIYYIVSYYTILYYIILYYIIVYYIYIYVCAYFA